MTTQTVELTAGAKSNDTVQPVPPLIAGDR